jgi:DNA-binding CsgD family transcriptional regulator
MKKSVEKLAGEEELNKPVQRPEIIVTERMLKEAQSISESAKHYARLERSGYALYDPHKRILQVCHSFFGNTMDYPVDSDKGGNCLEHIEELTHPDFTEHIAGVESDAYDFLMNLPAEERSNFYLVFLRLMKSKENGYVCVVHKINVAVMDDNKVPYLLMLKTEQLMDMEKEKEDYFRHWNMLPYNFIQPKKTGSRCLKQLLTPTQFEVALLHGIGMTNQKMAKLLFLSPETIRTHFDHIRSKLHVNNMDKIAVFFFQDNNDLAGTVETMMKRRNVG